MDMRWVFQVAVRCLIGSDSLRVDNSQGEYIAMGEMKVPYNEPIGESPCIWNCGPEPRMPSGCIPARRTIERIGQHVGLPQLYLMIYQISIMMRQMNGR